MTIRKLSIILLLLIYFITQLSAKNDGVSLVADIGYQTEPYSSLNLVNLGLSLETGTKKTGPIFAMDYVIGLDIRIGEIDNPNYAGIRTNTLFLGGGYRFRFGENIPLSLGLAGGAVVYTDNFSFRDIIIYDFGIGARASLLWHVTDIFTISIFATPTYLFYELIMNKNPAELVLWEPVSRFYCYTGIGFGATW